MFLEKLVAFDFQPYSQPATLPPLLQVFELAKENGSQLFVIGQPLSILFCLFHLLFSYNFSLKLKALTFSAEVLPRSLCLLRAIFSKWFIKKGLFFVVEWFERKRVKIQHLLHKWVHFVRLFLSKSVRVLKFGI